ncbi:MAG: Ig-like domain-containing protein [Acidimicrobiia bacterium]|nr:Ig-like domain-containing protein [Acidimicrobiia bacterium]
MATKAGPTQGAERHEETVNRWKSRPRLAWTLRALIVILPIASSIAFTALAGRVYSAEDLGIGRWTWIFCVFILANLLLAALRQVTSRLLPLVALMKLTLVFPDNAPSRAKATLRKSSSRTMLRNMEEARANGETEGAAGHGEYLAQLLTEVNEHDRLTRGHSERVRSYAEMIGEELKLDDDDMNKLRWSALLHDVGKISVPSEILNKNGRPTEEEWKILSNHPTAGIEMLEPLRPWLGDWIHSADQHHCRWDGNGYPEKLKGKEISLAGRLVAIADAYDVMTSARSYKKPLGPELARQELTSCAGEQFDPTLVRAFLQIGLTRLKTVAGPLAWLANLTGSLQLPVPAAGVVTSGAVSASVASAGIAVATFTGLVAPTEPDAPVLAFEDPVPVEEVVEEVVEDLVIDPIVVNSAEGTRVEIVIRARGGEGELDFTINEPEHGTVTVIEDTNPTDTAFLPDAGDGYETTVVYIPDAGFFGEDTFTLEVCDAGNVCESHTATIRVQRNNRAPVANDDETTVAAGERILVDVLLNDSDPDGDLIRVTGVGSAEHGDVRLVGSSVVYEAEDGYDGVDTFTYTVDDGESATATGQVTVTVVGPPAPTTTTTTTAPTTTTTVPPTTTTTAPTTTTTVPPNPVPIVVDESASVVEDGTVLIPALANDNDPEGEALTLVRLTAPSNGAAVIEAGQIRYTPTADYNGPDSFTYTVSDGANEVVGTVNVTVDPVNDPPVVAGSGLTLSELAATGSTAFIVNATDVDNDPLSYTIVSGNGAGLFAIDPDGAGSTLSPLDFETQSVHTLGIEVTDGTIAQVISVDVTVTDINETPIAGDDLVATTEDTPAVFALGANDFDPDVDVLTWQIPATTDNGTALVAVDGDVSYTPPSNVSGADGFTYTVTDPDGLVSAPANVTIMIVSDNDPPVANDDAGLAFALAEDSSITTGNVTANDTDVDNPVDATSVAIVTDVTNGTLTNNNDGTFDYTPDLNHNGTDTFTYTITDGALTSNTATVTLTISPDNDAPVAADDSGVDFTVLEDGSFTTGNVTANDTDVDNPVDATSVAIVTDVTNGTLTNNNDGTFDYTPDLNHNGTDTFTYTITDGALTSNTATVTLTITPDNDAPVVTDPGDQAGISGEPFSLQIVGSDVDSATVTYGATGLPGGVSIDVDGLISGTPAAGGTSTITVTATDDGSPGLSDSVTFDLVVDDYQVSSLAGTLHITEVLYVGTTVPTEEFVEITNSGATPIDLTNFRLADSDLKNDGAQTVDYSIPTADHWGTASTLQPGEQAVIWLSYDGATLPPVTNPATGLEYVINNGGAATLGNFGDSVWLLETPSLIIDYMAYFGGGGDTAPPASLNLWDSTDQGSLFVGALGRSLALTPHNVDGNTASCWEESGSGAAAARCPGAPATIDSPAGGLRHSAGLNNNGGGIYGAHVMISEFSNVGGATGTNDFIELYNPTAAPVDIEGWQLEIADDTAIQQTILLTGANTVLPSGGHYLIDELGTGDQTLVGMTDALAIRIRDGATAVDEVGTAERNNGGSENPGLWSEGTGVPPLTDIGGYEQSWERLLASGVGNCIDTEDNSVDFIRRLTAAQVNPQSSADPVEPCGAYAAPTPPNHLVITEFRSDGPNGGGDEFLEVFNPTSGTISLSGYELRKSGSGGDEYIFPAVDLAPGQHYLVGGNNYPGPVDGIHNGFGNGDGGVDLYDTNAGSIVDSINTDESPPNLPRIDGQIDQTYTRRAGGCQDTDVMIDDFYLTGAPTPRTSSDTAIPC